MIQEVLWKEDTLFHMNLFEQTLMFFLNMSYTHLLKGFHQDLWVLQVLHLQKVLQVLHLQKVLQVLHSLEKPLQYPEMLLAYSDKE